MKYVSARQRYFCYVVYLIANNDFVDCILEQNMFPNLKFIMWIYILMVNFNSYIFEAVNDL